MRPWTAAGGGDTETGPFGFVVGARLDLFEGIAVAFPRDWVGLWLRQLDEGRLGELGYQR